MHSHERKKKSVAIEDKELHFETGKIARQAHGAVTVRMGDTMVFTTCCSAPSTNEEADFIPLRVDYQEKFFSAGKTLGGFIKREGRPSKKETLTSRLIDRPIRPMFEEGFYDEVQILSYVWSYDGIHPPEPLAICGASCALALSHIPLIKPIGAVRVGFIEGKFIINPSPEQQKSSRLDLIVAGTDEAVLMIEGFCDFLNEEEVMQAIQRGHEAIKKICHAIDQFAKEHGRPKDRSTIRKIPDALISLTKELVQARLIEALQIPEKKKREAAEKALSDEYFEKLFPEGETPKFKKGDAKTAFKNLHSDLMRKMILDSKIRSDGRDTKTIRPIDVEQALLPRAHGSSLFTRGETQTLAVCTLGGESMGQKYEHLDGDGLQRFYLQYFFPPFSVGEVGRIGTPGRREMGHGELAERALLPILPSKEQFPYTIRLESNITESNGSSSMASVCGGSLAMMDAGVPIKRPVSGIAMGLILEQDRYVVLSDILGVEDALGDMDFKITGDKEGITAFQMDIKVEGITLDIMRAALLQAKEGRIHILEKMIAACPASKSQMSTYAPRIESIRINPSKIGAIIGPGGKMIRKISEESGAEISIDDSGIISLSCSSPAGIEKAKAMINAIVAEIEIGKIYEGRVTNIQPFGIFVEILPGKEGLCHISEFDLQRIDKLENYVKVGDTVSVKVLEIDFGKVKLSRKATLTTNR